MHADAGVHRMHGSHCLLHLCMTLNLKSALTKYKTLKCMYEPYSCLGYLLWNGDLIKTYGPGVSLVDWGSNVWKKGGPGREQF